MGRQNNAVEVVAPQTSAGELDEVPLLSHRDGRPRNDQALPAEGEMTLPGAVDTGSPPELLAITGAAQIAASVAPGLVPVPPRPSADDPRGSSPSAAAAAAAEEKEAEALKRRGSW